MYKYFQAPDSEKILESICLAVAHHAFSIFLILAFLTERFQVEEAYEKCQKLLFISLKVIIIVLYK